jgi:hypothetical protein
MGSFSTGLGGARHVRFTPGSRRLGRTSRFGSFVPTTDMAFKCLCGPEVDDKFNLHRATSASDVA